MAAKTATQTGLEQLRQSDVMAHLLDALEKKQDIGHYGRLVFAMVARHFLDEEQVVGLLTRDPKFSEAEARSLYTQVQTRDYNPPRRERILEWQAKQDFPICPNSNDPGACNLYRDLQFPEGVYEDIEHFYEEKADAPDDGKK